MPIVKKYLVIGNLPGHENVNVLAQKVVHTDDLFYDLLNLPRSAFVAKDGEKARTSYENILLRYVGEIAFMVHFHESIQQPFDDWYPAQFVTFKEQYPEKVSKQCDAFTEKAIQSYSDKEHRKSVLVNNIHVALRRGKISMTPAFGAKIAEKCAKIWTPLKKKHFKDFHAQKEKLMNAYAKLVPTINGYLLKSKSLKDFVVGVANGEMGGMSEDLKSEIRTMAFKLDHKGFVYYCLRFRCLMMHGIFTCTRAGHIHMSTMNDYKLFEDSNGSVLGIIHTYEDGKVNHDLNDSETRVGILAHTKEIEYDPIVALSQFVIWIVKCGIRLPDDIIWSGFTNTPGVSWEDTRNKIKAPLIAIQDVTNLFHKNLTGEEINAYGVRKLHIFRSIGGNRSFTFKATTESVKDYMYFSTSGDVANTHYLFRPQRLINSSCMKAMRGFMPEEQIVIPWTDFLDKIDQTLLDLIGVELNTPLLFYLGKVFVLSLTFSNLVPDAFPEEFPTLFNSKDFKQLAKQVQTYTKVTMVDREKIPDAATIKKKNDALTDAYIKMQALEQEIQSLKRKLDEKDNELVVTKRQTTDVASGIASDQVHKTHILAKVKTLQSLQTSPDFLQTLIDVVFGKNGMYNYHLTHKMKRWIVPKNENKHTSYFIAIASVLHKQLVTADTLRNLYKSSNAKTWSGFVAYVVKNPEVCPQISMVYGLQLSDFRKLIMKDTK